MPQLFHNYLWWSSVLPQKTLEANTNPTAADIATAQNAIDAADAAIVTATEAATSYSDSAIAAGEVVEATTIS